MAQVTKIQKGEIREGKKGKYIYMWYVKEYYFCDGVWDNVKSYMGFLPNFPADFGLRWNKWIISAKPRERNDVELMMKFAFTSFKKQTRHNQILTMSKYMEEKQYIMTGHSGFGVYGIITKPTNFTEIEWKVGDKTMIDVGQSCSGELLCFTETKDIDVPVSDYIQTSKKTKFNPRFATFNGGVHSAYIPVVITSITKQKVKFDYYKYIQGDHIHNEEGHFVPFEADWSERQGKMAINWSQKYRIPEKYIIKDFYGDNVNSFNVKQN